MSVRLPCARRRSLTRFHTGRGHTAQSSSDSLEREHKMLDNLTVLEHLIINNPYVADETGRPGRGEMYCPKCGDTRRMYVLPISTPLIRKSQKLNMAAPTITQLVPSLFSYVCVQCDTQFTALIYQGPDGPTLAVLPSRRGGLTTPHTPPGVAYYLDQAHKSRSVGANSAAVSMYRGALEHLLFEQGYKTGMLGQKIASLLDAIQKGTAPKWAAELDTDFIEVLKDLGNGSIHPNDGDVTKQAALDNVLLALVNETFQMLLFLVCESPYKKQDMLTTLRTKAQVLKK